MGSSQVCRYRHLIDDEGTRLNPNSQSRSCDQTTDFSIGAHSRQSHLNNFNTSVNKGNVLHNYSDDRGVTTATGTPSFSSPQSYNPEINATPTNVPIQPENLFMFSANDNAFSQFTFDWGITDIDSNIFESIEPPIHAESDGLSRRSIFGPEREIEIVKALKAEEVDGETNVEDLPNGSPEESPWVRIYHDTPTFMALTRIKA